MENSPIDIRYIIKTIKRRKWFLVAPVVLALGAAYIKVATTVPVYESRASILLGRNTYITSSMSRVLAGAQSRNRERLWNRRQTIIKQIYSTQLLNKVIERIGLEPTEGQKAKARQLAREHPDMLYEDILRSLQIKSLKKKVIVSIPRRGEYFEIGGRSTDPEKAYLIAKTVAELFIEENLLQELTGVKKTLKFSNEQLQIAKRKLEDAERRWREYRRTMSKDSDIVLPVTTENLPQVRSLLASISVDLSEKYDRLNYLEKRLGGLTSEIRLFRSDRATQLKAKLIEKISKLAELMINFSWNSSEVLDINREIVTLKEALIKEIRENSARGLNGRFTSEAIELAIQREIVLNEIDLLKQQKVTLERLIKLYRSKQNKLPAHEIVLKKLEAEVQKNREIYQIFLEQVQSMKIREAMQQTEAQILYRILDPAQIPVVPVNTEAKKLILMALLVGLGIGGGLVYLLEMLDNSFKSVDEVEKYLGLIVIGTVPKINFGNQDGKDRKWAIPVVAFSLIMILIVGFVLLKKLPINF